MKVLNGNHTLTIAAQVTDLQMALCDVFEQVMEVMSNG